MLIKLALIGPGDDDDMGPPLGTTSDDDGEPITDN
jgi:hypothetical protein